MIAPALFFDTEPAWIEAIRAWACSEPRIVRAWVFGSRATGERTPKDNPDPVPDLDVGFLIEPKAGETESEALGYVISAKPGWAARLASIPVTVDLQLAEPATDERVWPAIEREGVLIYERGEVER
jgi:predicted nucleotidyltransferase